MVNLVIWSLMVAAYVLTASLCLSHLSGERWQIMATVPVQRLGADSWRGANLTWYGFFLATAVVAAAILFMVLMLSLRLPAWEAVLFIVTILALCLPAAGLVAWIVEGKRHTLTVGGASFVGLLAAPPLLLAGNAYFPVPIPILPAMAALAVAYALGEGLGRVACISFGCCYGKALSACRPWLQHLFRRYPVIFRGSTRKACYEGKMEGVPLVPVQAASIMVNGLLFAAGTALFFLGHFAAAMLLCLVGTQLWRTLSEFLRADYRGGNRISSYQKMSMAAIFFVLGLGFLLPDHHAAMLNLTDALRVLWNPLSLLLFQGLWLLVFLYTGRSMVTGATLHFHLHQHRI